MIVTIKIRPVRVKIFRAEAEEIEDEIIYFDMPERVNRRRIRQKLNLHDPDQLLEFKIGEPENHFITVDERKIQDGNY